MKIKMLPLIEFILKMKALQHVYAYMDVGGRATQEQLPSSPVCSSDYVKSSLLRVLRSRYLCIHARQITKGITIGQESMCHEAHDSKDGGGRAKQEARAEGCARTAISSFFASLAPLSVHPCTTPHYASQANTTAWMQEVERIRKTESRTTLHAVQLRILG